MRLGEKIRALRLRRGMTQAELAGDCITRNMLSRIENGAALPSIGSLLHIAEALEVSPAYFFDDSERPQSETESTLCSLYNEGEYEKCISVGSALPASVSGSILAQCCLNLAVSDLLARRQKSARESLLMAKEYCESSTDITDAVYNIVLCLLRMLGESFDTGLDELSSATLPLYRSMASNFYMFLIANATACRDENVLHENVLYGLHLAARSEMSSGDLEAAKQILLTAMEKLDDDTAPALSYMICDDIEKCAAADGDYRLAYEASRRKQQISPAT